MNTASKLGPHTQTERGTCPGLGVAATNTGVGPCREKACGDMIEAMARIAPSQPNEAMARIAPRSPIVPMVKNKVSLDQS